MARITPEIHVEQWSQRVDSSPYTAGTDRQSYCFLTFHCNSIVPLCKGFITFDHLSKNPTCLHNFCKKKILQCPRNGIPKFHPFVVSSFGIIVLRQ